MPVRKASAVWEGTLREGKGSAKASSGAFEVALSFSTRFEETPGTNPEELIGAAHAGCFSMALSGGLGRAGFTAEYIHTTASVHINPQPEGGFKITRIELSTEAKVPGLDDAAFQQIAEATKGSCPVSKALAAVSEIALTAKLVN
jgi:osmotically inducible protein OsmC